MNYIIPAILALLVGYILWQIKKERVSLSYLLTESDDFPRDKGTGKYFIIELRNNGNTAIENIAINVQFNTDVIDTASYSDKKLVNNIMQTSSFLNGEIPLLNPKESFKITITAAGKENIASPKFSARAIGVTATPHVDDSNINSILQIVTLSVTAATLGYSMYTAYNVIYKADRGSLNNIESIKKDLENIKGEIGKTLNTDNIESLKTNIKKIQSELNEATLKKDEYDEYMKNRRQGTPERQQHIFSIFNQSGISQLFPDLIENNGDVEYWKTGAYLMHQFLKDKTNRKKYVKAMKKLVEIDAVAPSSYGFNLYLLAKMEQHSGNTDNALKYLAQCRKKTPLMYEYLMAQDPSYDTKELEKFYLNEN